MSGGHDKPWWTLLLLLPGIASHATAPAPLLHNPFSRPPSVVSVESPPLVAADGTIQPLDLRATMVGSKNGLANVAGRTLRPGDEVQGYTLLRVFEDRAVFLRDGKRLTVYVKPERIEEDE